MARRIMIYADIRVVNYPTAEEQLEALYEARHGDTSALEKIDQRIAEVKGSRLQEHEGSHF